MTSPWKARQRDPHPDRPPAQHHGERNVEFVAQLPDLAGETTAALLRRGAAS